MGIAASARERAIETAAEEEAAAQQGGLITPAQFREKAAADLDKALEEYATRIGDGLRVLWDQYERVKSASRPEDAIPFLEPGYFTSREQALASIPGDDDADLDPADTLGVSLDDLSRAHDLVATMFEEERFEDAAKALFCLANLSPEAPELSLSLGHAEFHCGRVETAVQCYVMSHACDPGNPRPLLHAAYCLNSLGNRADALEFIGVAEDLNREMNDEQVSRDIEQLRQAA